MQKKLLIKNFNKVYYHPHLDAYFTNRIARADDRIYDMDHKVARKVDKGNTYYMPIFFETWVTDWIPSGLVEDKSLRLLTKEELKLFKTLYG